MRALEPVKAAVVKENYLDTLRAIDPELVKTVVQAAFPAMFV